jgi:hypothetical protein
MTVMVNKPMIWLVAMSSGNHHALLGALMVKSGFPCIPYLLPNRQQAAAVDCCGRCVVLHLLLIKVAPVIQFV